MDKRVYYTFFAIIMLSILILILEYAFENKPSPSPIAYSPLSPRVGEPIEFNPASEAKKYSWDFGDSSVNSNTRNPVHVYKQQGNYFVILKADQHVDSLSISVEAKKRVNPIISIPPLLKVGQNATFYDNTPGAKEWEWKFNDGILLTGKVATYNIPKNDTVKVAIHINGDSITGDTTIKITVDNNKQPPVISPPYVALQPSPQPPPHTLSAPELKLDQDQFDFGTISQGTPVTHDFNFTNTGEQPLIISNVTSSCSCIVPKGPNAPVPSGQTSKISITYDATQVGGFSKTVMITSNIKTGTSVIFIKGTVQSKPMVLPQKKGPPSSFSTPVTIGTGTSLPPKTTDDNDFSMQFHSYLAQLAYNSKYGSTNNVYYIKLCNSLRSGAQTEIDWEPTSYNLTNPSILGALDRYLQTGNNLTAFNAAFKNVQVQKDLQGNITRIIIEMRIETKTIKH